MVGHKMFNKPGSVATANDSGSGVFFFANHFGGNSRGCGVGGVFGESEKAVPDDGIGVGDSAGDFGSS